MIHALKTETSYFNASAEGVKRFEVRKNDRPYAPGDYVALNEWNGEGYTGRCTLHKIIYIIPDTEYCKEGFVILGLEPCAIRTRGETPEFTSCNRGAPVYGRGGKRQKPIMRKNRVSASWRRRK